MLIWNVRSRFSSVVQHFTGSVDDITDHHGAVATHEIEFWSDQLHVVDIKRDREVFIFPHAASVLCLFEQTALTAHVTQVWRNEAAGDKQVLFVLRQLDPRISTITRIRHDSRRTTHDSG